MIKQTYIQWFPQPKPFDKSDAERLLAVLARIAKAAEGQAMTDLVRNTVEHIQRVFDGLEQGQMFTWDDQGVMRFGEPTPQPYEIIPSNEPLQPTMSPVRLSFPREFAAAVERIYGDRGRS